MSFAKASSSGSSSSIHPEIWVYPGETMGETMAAMLDAERDRRRELLAEDRIDLS